jgi:hypothetical protein
MFTGFCLIIEATGDYEVLLGLETYHPSGDSIGAYATRLVGIQSDGPDRAVRRDILPRMEVIFVGGDAHC